MIEKSGGEFAIYDSEGNETWVSNTFTKEGVKSLLRSAFHRAGPIWSVGLCANPPAESISLADIVEPDGTNGYTRRPLPFNVASWPVISELVGQVYIRSAMVTFALTGPISTPVNRLFITDGLEVIAIGTPLPGLNGELITLNSDFNTNYRFYLR